MCSKSKITLLFLLTFLIQSLYAARPYAVAGSFYPEDKDELSTQLRTFFKNADDFNTKNINAIIVPHAGYVFSAQTSATAYKTLNKKYKNIFLIGSSHYVNINGASIYNIGNYKTPLGEIEINQEIVSQLKNNFELYTYDLKAHQKEHTLEVQLPFLQTIYGKGMKIVPIIIATSNLSTIRKISKTLEPYFNDDNLFIISTDLSHYPSYANAKKIDKKTLDAIVTNNTKVFINAIGNTKEKNINKLQTAACGWSSVLALMYLTQDSKHKYELLDYKNSGDSKYGDKKRVVGYGAIRIYKDNEDDFLTQKEKNELLAIAKLSLYEATLNNKKISIDESKISQRLKKPLGAFVTLYKDSKLRGCVGRFEPNQALYSVVVDMAIAASRDDSRFKKVSKDELNKISIEVSVLTPRKRIDSIDEIVMGKHGIYIKKGSKNGTYLPHVASQMNWDVNEFVKSCATEKAGLKETEIKDAELFIYEAIVFD